MKKKGLGKGLGALLEVDDDNQKDVTEIDINSIDRDKSQPRKDFNKEEIQSLAQSIKENGIIQPIIVRKTGETYTIVAGERRWRAAKEIRLKKVPVIIKDLTDQQVLEISIIENIQRKDLNSIEEANAFRRLMDEFNMTQSQVSKSVGKSRSAIANTLRLLSLNKEIQQYIAENKLSEGHGRALLAIEDEETRNEIAKEVIEKGLSVREVEKLAKKKPKKEKKPLSNETMYEEEFKNVENALAKKLGTKVSISRNVNKGKITIEYYSMDGLNRIIDLISKKA